MLEWFLESAISCSREIDAPVETVWSVISHVDSFDQIFSGVTRVERLGVVKEGEKHGAADSIRVGMKYRIHRAWPNGTYFYGDWTVTHVNHYESTIKSESMENNDSDEGESSCDSDCDREPTITTLREEPTYSITFFSANVAGGITSSSTWSVCSASVVGNSNNRTIASISIALLPTRLCYMVGRLVCSCALQRKARELTEKDLEDIATAAERIARERA